MRKVFVTVIILIFCLWVRAEEYVTFSCTLSGTILLGVGYAHEVDGKILQGGIYTGFRGKPCGVSVGYHYRFKSDSRWSWQAGIEADLMVARDPGKGMKYLPLIKLVPGGAYKLNGSFFSPHLWIAFFPIQKKVAPVGIEFKYWYEK